MASELLRLCMKKGFLLDREMLEVFSSIDESKAEDVVSVMSGLGITERVINKKVFLTHQSKIKAAMNRFLGQDEFDSVFSSVLGVQAPSNVHAHSPQMGEDSESSDATKEGRSKVKLINAPAFPQRKVTVTDFVTHFRSRFDKIKVALENRDFDDLTTIRKIGNNKGTYTIIGCVIDKRITKNKNLMLTVEDLTGTTTVLINNGKKELFESASSLLLDDIIAFSVSGNSDLLFCNEIAYPEASLSQKRKHDEDVWVAFTSDYHCGSKQFLEKETLRFIKWINGEGKDDRYRDIAKNIKYLFVVGDLVDGVNHYPGQEKDLNITTCRGQYKKFEELIDLVRKDIEIIISPGNHDAVWVGEPQPIISEKWAEGLYKMENVHMVPNPALVEIAGEFKVLMYHGASMHSFVEEIPEIRTKYGRQSPTVMVKEMIKRRHLAPIHGLVDYIPCEVDPMVITPTPDIIVTGDLHVVDVSMKNNILLVASSCFQATTDFMEKVGLKPDPCKVPLFNLKTREVKILDFSDEAQGVEWDKSEDLFCKIEDTEQNAEVAPEVKA